MSATKKDLPAVDAAAHAVNKAEAEHEPRTSPVNTRDQNVTAPSEWDGFTDPMDLRRQPSFWKSMLLHQNERRRRQTCGAVAQMAS